MTQLIDCYFLIEKRNKEDIYNFLNEFVPLREETSDDYINNTGDLVFTDADSLIDYLESNTKEETTVYWRNLEVNNPIKFGIALFTNDDRIILGYSINASSFQDAVVQDTFYAAQESLKSSTCCMTVEEIAPSNSDEFIDFCKNRYVPNLNSSNKCNF